MHPLCEICNAPRACGHYCADCHRKVCMLGMSPAAVATEMREAIERFIATAMESK